MIQEVVGKGGMLDRGKEKGFRGLIELWAAVA
jgi:hypothetical protein